LQTNERDLQGLWGPYRLGGHPPVYAVTEEPDGSVRAVRVARAVATYLGPWSELDGPFSPARAAQVGDLRRLDLLDEIADNVFVLVRLASALGADFREVLQNKWDIVRYTESVALPRPSFQS
jgi:hypothetical protein